MFTNLNKNRLFYYFLGIIILALGLTLNTKANLGVSPLLSISLSVSTITGFDFANATLIMYSVLVLLEMIIHFFQKRDKSYYIVDLLQIAFSLVFTRFLGIFVAVIPMFSVETVGPVFGSIVSRVIVLILAIMLTGIGVVLTLNMKLVPNPGDGIVQAISSVIHKDIGLTKNIFDFTCVLITLAICFIFNDGHIIGINVGTLLAMFGVGRAMALFNHFFLKYLIKSAKLLDD